MIQIRFIRNKFQNKKNELLTANYQLAEKRLSDFIGFCEKTEIIKSILDKLPNTAPDWAKWEQSLWGANDLGLPEDEAEAASFCWQVLKKYKGNSLNIAINFHPSSNNITDHLQAYFETFVPFIYEYLDIKLQELEFQINPIDIANEIYEFVDNQSLLLYPEINERLSDTYSKLYLAKTNDDYSGIANNCRSIIISLADKVYKDEFQPQDLPTPKNDDAKTKLCYTYKALHKEMSGHLMEARKKFIGVVWDMVTSTLHRKKIEKDEIKEIVLLTYLLTNYFISDRTKTN